MNPSGDSHHGQPPLPLGSSGWPGGLSPLLCRNQAWASQPELMQPSPPNSHPAAMSQRFGGGVFLLGCKEKSL